MPTAYACPHDLTDGEPCPGCGVMAFKLSDGRWAMMDNSGDPKKHVCPGISKLAAVAAERDAALAAAPRAAFLQAAIDELVLLREYGHQGDKARYDQSWETAYSLSPALAAARAAKKAKK